ncbi:MAG: 2,3-diketo-5-methylthiopentyl-1-phosphate enolase [Candidatus Omnitrophica bacterium]|nr:2,3-diketo-5-methylthiopentyl-1-phosphate enolase [Candidatus Omnitrophota bacterium]
MREMVIATYRLRLGPGDVLEQKGEQIALGQTVGAWTPVRDAHPEIWAQHRGEVVSVAQEADAGIARVAFPTANCEPDLPSLLTMVFGKVSLDGWIKLLDLEFPPAWLAQFPGPKVGIAGLRRRLGVAEAPLTMAIFKPCVGLSAEQLGAMFYELASGGLDLVKDDEILPDLPTAKTERRLEACLAAAGRVKRETGRTVLYAVNLTGPVDMLRERARRLQSQGATCLLFNVLAYGWGALEALARDPELTTPILAHPALSGGLCGAPDHGMSYSLVLGRMMRLAGADLVLYPAHYGTFPFPAEEEFAIRDALRQPMGSLAPAWPGPSVGIHPGMVPRLLADYGRDVVINAGGGIHGHPRGAQAGARAMRQAVELALAGRPFTEPLPSGHGELAVALTHWGVA